ncbi:MAG: histidine--tRNA ligase [Candidatus Pacebacteria bacterium CG_4_10_14_0_8_um_filter_43_12]|nr:MAG: histidine--tRNA ligase [Candidatus Pacebacteria bacterium CG_4_10_14_0_8_um_filter_43_12]
MPKTINDVKIKTRLPPWEFFIFQRRKMVHYQYLKGSMTTVQTLKGFRDFLPEEKRKRDVVAQTMRQVFANYGYAPLETPTLEYAELLLGKYGKEADKLVYQFTDRGEREVALRYDQTVPTARVLAQYQNELPPYFRRYQIQNVFRADKPQRGRYREFIQSDCDIFGSTSPVADAEILAVFYAVYEALGVRDLRIEINGRQTLFGTLEPFASANLSVLSLCQTIDKADKQTETELQEELQSKGLSVDQADQLFTALKKAEMSNLLQEIVNTAVALGVPKSTLKFNPNLARGLDYYTGLIFEGRIPEYGVGSIGGGGRYDNLINQLSGQNIPAVGFGIGFDRTVEAVDQLGLLTKADQAKTQVLVTLFSLDTLQKSLETAQKLRAAGIATEVYPALDKLSKQFKLADQKKIPYVVVIGDEELAEDKVTLKQMQTRKQEKLSLIKVIAQLIKKS